MPLQPPVIVTFHKKATKEEPTGRIVEYRSRSLTNPSFVTLDSKAPHDQEITTFGKTEEFFTYRSVKFAVVSRFECSTHSLYGLTRITDTSSTVKMIIPLEEVSRPLVVAHDCNCNELWILNAT